MIILRSFVFTCLVVQALADQGAAQVRRGPDAVNSDNNFVARQQPLPQGGGARPRNTGAEKVDRFENPPAVAVPRGQPQQFQNPPQVGNLNPQHAQPAIPNQNMVRQGAAHQRNQLPDGLATSEECREDVQRICGDKVRVTNLEVLSCMTDRIQNDEDLSDTCHRHLWQFKLNVTKDAKFVRVAKEVCKTPLDKLSECAQHNDLSGKLIPCLLDHKNEIEYRPCYHFLVKMGTIIFSDYRLICDFVEECSADIIRYQCGRISGKTNQLSQDQSQSHSQGATIRCLEDKIVEEKDVNEKCAKQIVRLSEFSSDDFHLDRNLYFACKDDREKFCEEVTAGEGRVYKCLFQHKFDHEMSEGCRDAMTARQHLIAHDYKASYDLQKYCTGDIKKLQCNANIEGMNDGNDIIGLSGMLLCLENAKRDLDNPQSISPQCEMQLGEFRRMLSDDYQMSPEIVHNCGIEISESCSGLEKDGGTIHCLMGLAQKYQGNSDRSSLGESCAKALIHVLKENGAASDYRMDRALAEACNPVVETLCSSYQPGDPLVLSCLMEHIHSSDMAEACEKRLLELQYFISRDFFLDQSFFKKCHKDAKILCDEDIKSADKNEVSMPFSLVISCLYRHIPNTPQSGKPRGMKGQTSRACTEEVRKAMKTRALDVNLNPDLEKACIHFLGKYCSPAEIDKGFELVCLQDHFENITNDEDEGDQNAEECIDMLEEITEIEEAEAGNLDNILLRACEPEIDRLCSDERDSDEEGDVMRCLIENKHELNKQCEAGVTHFQLIELQDIKFSYAFMKACKEDIKEYCTQDDRKHPTSKVEIVECLSGMHLDSVVKHEQSPLADTCAEQLTLENLQRHEEDMKLNPQLKKVCQADYKKFCKNGKVKGLECLRQNHDKITPKCRKELFKMEKEEAIDPHLDVNLMRGCKTEIKKLCDTSADPESILECLVHHKSEITGRCFDIVREREREEFSDVHLNPELEQKCHDDIKLHCGEILQDMTREENAGEDIHGEVINCLRDIELDQSLEKQLSKKCSRHIQFIMKEEAGDYKLDPMLTLHCLEPIQAVCPPTSVNNVVECLKMVYFQGKLQKYQECMVQIARLLKEGRSDIMADPVLHDACNLDIQNYCMHIPEGKSRIVRCILTVIERGGKPVSQRCVDNIMQRKEMWNFAHEKGHMDSLMEFGSEVMNSPHRSYLLTLISVILLGILVFGILCGRVTKRVSMQRKML